MASTVLPNGIIVPEKFSRDWYADLYHNWQELDNLLGGGTPKDGTLTIQKNGDTVGTFSANQATDETVNIEVPDVNNGTLTIQQNGTTVDSFSANSSSDKTVNIQCVDLTNNQTVGGDKEFTGTTTAHDLVPSATDTYNLGTSTNKWKTINSFDVTGIGHIGWDVVDQSGDTQTYTRTNPNLGHYAHYCVAPDNGWVACREHGGSGTFQVCSLEYNLNGDPTVVSPPLDQYKFGSVPVRKGEYYAIISDNESASYTMRFICNNG